MRLHFREYGTGRPLVILHGLFGSGDNWHTIARKLETRGIRVIAADLRNHGRSPHRDDITFPAMAGDVFELIESLSLANACVAGHSLGGKVAMELALSRPEAVGSLVSIDMAPKRYNPHHVDLRDAMLSLDLTAIRSRREAEEALAGRVPDRTVQLFLLKNLVHEDDGRFHWQLNLKGISEHFDQTGEPIARGRRYDGPALFVRGELSDYVDERVDAALIHELFPAARIVTIPGAGHWTHADRPDAVIETLASFVRGESGRG